MGQTVSECKPCSPAVPEADTVKVDMTLLAATGQKGPDGDNQQGAAEEQQRREAEEKRLKEQCLEKERLEKERRQAEEEMEEARRRAAEEEEELARQQEEAARRRAEEEEAERQRQRKLEEAAGAMRVKAEQEAKAAAAKAKAEMESAQKAVDAFLKARGFKQLTAPRKAVCGSAVYPIHQAVEENNAELVKAMVRCGADLQQKNASKKTPLEFASKCNKNGSHDLVVKALRGEM